VLPVVRWSFAKEPIKQLDEWSMTTREDRLLALVLSGTGLAIAFYAIAVDSHSQLAPQSLALQGVLGVTLVLVSGIGFISTLTLLIARKSLVYLIPCCGWLVALARLFFLWS
jgi:hypothetical protein